MTDITLETIRAIVLLGIVVFLWNAGRGRFNLSRQGWGFIIGGFGLLLFGSVLDITDNFKSLNRFVVIGDTEAEAFLEKFVGFLGGFLLLAIGLIRWIPRVQSLSDLVEDRTKELHEANELLVGEITERKNVEKALHGSEDLLNSIIENAPVGLLIKDTEHIVERANKTYLNWYGFDADTMVGRRSDEIEDFQSAEEAELMNAQEREVLTTGLTQARQVDRLFADGQIHTIDITKFPVYDQQGNITKVGSVSVDLTDQVQAQRALEQSDSRFRAVVNTSPAAITLKRRDGRYLLVNDTFAKWMGTDKSKIVGRTVYDFLPEAQAAAVEEEDHHLMEKGDQTIGEATRSFPDGVERTVLINRCPIRNVDGDIHAIATILTDITDRKRMEEALVESEEKHRHFSADVAHELRTPLAVMRSHLDNLENTKTIQSLSKDVDAMSRLVSQLLSTTQLDSLTLNPNDEADLHAIGTEVAKYLAPFAIKEGRSIEMTGTQDPVIVRGNDEALEMAVRNLVENALRYSARETVVTIHVSDEPAISVINRGRGIPPEQQEVIFQRFKRSDRRSGGAGLGLSIVQRVVQAHQATIDVSEAPGGGTIFKISFPFHKSLKVVAS